MDGVISRIDNGTMDVRVNKNTPYSTILNELRKTIVEEDDSTLTFKAHMEIKPACGSIDAGYYIGFRSLNIENGHNGVRFADSIYDNFQDSTDRGLRDLKNGHPLGARF